MIDSHRFITSTQHASGAARCNPVRRLLLLTAIGMVPVCAALSQGSGVAQAAAATPPAGACTAVQVCGTWSLIQASSASQLTSSNSDLNASLTTPGIKGLSVRVPWTSIDPSLSIFTAGYNLAQSYGLSYTIRFMAGTSTPTADLGNSVPYSGGGLLPLPWGPGTTATSFVPNTVFENAYTSVVSQMATFARSHGIHELHLPWFGGPWAELYLGPEIMAAPGYSYQNFLAGQEDLIKIGMHYAGSGLAVEFPFTGIGTGQADGDLANFITSNYGAWSPDIIEQSNNLTDASSGSSGGGWSIYNGRQMDGGGDYNWSNVYQTLNAAQSLSVEVYDTSFDPSLPHASLLRSQIASFASSSGGNTPGISSVSPSAGPVDGGQVVTVGGNAFATGMSVTVGGTPVTPTSVTTSSFAFTTPAGAPGYAPIQVTTTVGTSPVTLTAGYTYVPLANYVPLTPFRILDTRTTSCVQCIGHPLSTGTTWKLALTGVTGLKVGTDPIPATATAVVLNVTEVAGTASSLLTVYPYGTLRPKASNLNFAPGKVIPNLVTVALGQGGAVDIYNAAGTVNVIADVEGYFAPEPASTVTGEFHPITPVRVCDTRSHSPTPACTAHGALGAESAMVVNVTGAGADAIPSDGTPEAAILNLTGVSGSASTYLSVFPTNSSGGCTYSGSHAPPFSTLNLPAGTNEANRVIVALGPSSSGPNTALCVYNAAGTINVLLDANGWFGSATATAGFQYQAIGPTRICDTRSGSGLPCAGHFLGSGGIDMVAVAGMAGMPASGSGSPAVAVIANLTAIAPTHPTYVTLYPASTTNRPPSTSDINVTAGEILPNLAVVAVDTAGGAGDGDVDVYSSIGNVNVVIDIEGWFQ